jgi:glycosyltransferase involved in cell wall biosynthesis
MTMRVVWAMNVAPPYRLPVWAALSRQVDLEVWLLATNEHNRRWSVPDAKGYGVKLLRTVGLQRGEAVHYALSHRVGLKGPRPDVIVLPGWDSPAAWQLMFWAKRRGVRTLAFNESTVESRQHHDGPVDRSRSWFFRHAGGVLTVSPGSTEAVLKSGVPRSRITELVNAVDVQRIRHGSSAENRPLETGPHTYLFAGQLVERKRPDLVIRALTLMAGESRLLIAGEGPMAGRLRDLVCQLGLGRRVDFLGYVMPSAMPAVLGRCDTLVLPSQEEVYGLIVTEALAAGLHVVVSDQAGVAQVIREMHGAWVVPPQLGPLAKGMLASAEAWSGPIPTPAVMGHSPEAMAAAIAAVAHAAVDSNRFPESTH